MQRIPGGVTQVSPYLFPLTGQTGSHSLSDDDLCTWCSHLLYRPGELSLCCLSIPEGHWPSRSDDDGYAQSCPSLHFNNPPEKKGNHMNNTLNLTCTVTDPFTSPQTDADGIVCTPVPDEQRAAFWPQHFGSIPQWIILEPRIFAWMGRFCEDYSGGVWNFYSLSNGGAFMAPEAENDGPWTLFNTLNGNGSELSAEAAGIAVFLMAYSHHACRTECDAMTEHYYSLRDYALNHAECSAIMHIID